MLVEHQETDWKFQNQYSKSTTFMEARMRRTGPSTLRTTTRTGIDEASRREKEPFQGNKKAALSSKGSNFSLESMVLLICLTLSLLILPLILPPLPPPPSLLLLLPICILALLMILAFMPSNVRDLTYTYL